MATELAFGMDGADPVELPLADGRRVPMRGKADRIDRTSDGTLVVLDYKTGSARSYNGLSAEDPHQGGRRLQLAVYGLAARQAQASPDAPVRADYWFTSAKGGWAKAGYEVSDEVLNAVSHAATTIVTGIEGGLFTPKPPPPSTSPWPECAYCDPDGLGTAELLRDWQGKLGDPTLHPYLALVAPDLFDEDGNLILDEAEEGEA